MRFRQTSIPGVVAVEIEPIEDQRGFFARAWCEQEFAENGLGATFVQENVGFSLLAGTLRGLHFQRAPFEEAKLVRCTAGAVWDVAVDLRQESATRRQWVGMELSAENRNMLHIPAGCAHGYLSLTDGAEIRYLTSHSYVPAAATGARFDDPAFAVEWPAEIRVVSEQDRNWPLFGSDGGTK